MGSEGDCIVSLGPDEVAVSFDASPELLKDLERYRALVDPRGELSMGELVSKLFATAIEATGGK